MIKIWTIRYSLFIPMIILTCRTISAQSSNYQIESFQDIYTELSTYESIALLTQGDLLWEYEFKLDFSFPFYDSLYTSIFYQEEAWGSLTGQDEDVALLLMNFTGSYTYDNVIDTSNIDSDVRFSHIQVDDKQAFVIQFTNNRFFADPLADSLNTYFNFQLWFFEGGVIEIHFGEMHMDGTPIYTPDKGFHCYSSGVIDTNEICGPYLGISNPLDEDDAIALSGSYNDFEVVGNQYSILTNLPPIGWIIRFKPRGVGVNDLNFGVEGFLVNPNPTNSIINIPYPNNQVKIFDSYGRVAFDSFTDQNYIDISSLIPGIYFMQILSEEKLYTGRFVKQ